MELFGGDMERGAQDKTFLFTSLNILSDKDAVSVADLIRLTENGKLCWQPTLYGNGGVVCTAKYLREDGSGFWADARLDWTAGQGGRVTSVNLRAITAGDKMLASHAKDSLSIRSDQLKDDERYDLFSAVTGSCCDSTAKYVARMTRTQVTPVKNGARIAAKTFSPEEAILALSDILFSDDCVVCMDGKAVVVIKSGLSGSLTLSIGGDELKLSVENIVTANFYTFARLVFRTTSGKGIRKYTFYPVSSMEFVANRKETIEQ